MSRDAAAALSGAGDTIVAEATVHGRGALSVIRASGLNCHQIARAVIRTWPKQPRLATLSEIRDSNGVLLDTAIVIRYDAPASFTGEDAFEISTHGGAVVPVTVLAALLDAGARMAQPGEFTRRAVLNGKLDLLQAEAIGDLVASSSRAAQRLALDQLDGGLSRRLIDLRKQIIGVEALIAYDIDFPEEDDGPIATDRILADVDALRNALGQLLATADTGELVREGALVVLVGVPNAGKSSLFNALVGQRRAIVTELPGTTRDAIEAVVEIGPWPLRLVDTAGLRDSHEPVERLGVEVSYEYLNRAAVALVCGANEEELDRAMGAIEGKTAAAIVSVHTKSDLFSDGPKGPRSRRAISVSALTGAGLDALTAAITQALDARAGGVESDAPILTRVRHRLCVAKAKSEVEAFRLAWGEDQIPAVVAAVHLRTATGVLEELIGRVDVENILDEVFARFCVGK
jgi:tRNA modification GTPase